MLQNGYVLRRVVALSTVSELGKSCSLDRKDRRNYETRVHIL